MFAGYYAYNTMTGQIVSLEAFCKMLVLVNLKSFERHQSRVRAAGTKPNILKRTARRFNTFSHVAETYQVVHESNRTIWENIGKRNCILQL